MMRHLLFIVLCTCAYVAALEEFGPDPFVVNDEVWNGYNPNGKKDFDYIIVGSGPAGTVAAWKLVNAGASVLLLEAGLKSNYISKAVPLFFADLYNPGLPNYEETDWGYKNEQPDLPQTEAAKLIPRSRLPGGNSNTNTMANIRGDRADFAEWELPGYSFDELLPYFKEIELQTIPGLDPYYHNYTGLWPIGKQSYTHPITLEAMTWFNKSGYGYTEDINNGELDGAEINQVNVVDGFRVTPQDSLFTDEFLSSTNFRFLRGIHVTKVLFNNKKYAIGVQYYNRTSGLYGVTYSKKEVLLAAGAYNSPFILLHSGVGPKQHLQQHGIPVVYDSKGVGKNLQDHILIGVIKQVTDAIKTVETALRPENIEQTTNEYFVNGTGAFASTVGEGYVFNHVLGDPIEVAQKRPTSDWEFGPVCFQENGLTPCSADPNDSYISMGPDIKRWSTGTVTLRDSNPFSKPVINHNLYGDPREEDLMIDGLIEIRAQLDKMLGDRQIREYAPGPDVTTRAQFREYIRTKSFTGYHPGGTTKMGWRYDDLAVVDLQGRVYGVKDLRVIDASVQPTIPRCNIHWSVVAIALKIADDIIDDAHYNKNAKCKRFNWRPTFKQLLQQNVPHMKNHIKSAAHRFRSKH